MKSFAQKTKDALCRDDATNREKGDKACCLRAELTGLSMACGAITLLGGGNLRLSLGTEHAGTSRRAVHLLRAGLGVTPGLRIARAARLGGRTRYELRLEGQDAREMMTTCGVAHGGLAQDRGVPRHCLLKKCCRAAFLRGLFLGCGTVSDPERGYHLELALADERAAQSVARFLRAFYALRAGVSARKSASVVYVKDAEGILSFLSTIGAYGAILDFENARIVREARNHANRMANCDSGNITKMLGAAVRHLDAIDRIERVAGLSILPDSLLALALERRRHPEASLEELGAALDPPVSKSGVHHRLRRIERIAESLETPMD